MSTLESTISMLETLPEEDLLAIQAIVKRFVVKENSPYAPLSKEEMLERLQSARKHADEGKVMDATLVSKNVRENC